jgi:hypothetical protein
MPEDNKLPRPDLKHPDQYERDLNPNMMEGLNYGTFGPQSGKAGPTGDEIKEFTREYAELTDDELKNIRILAPGSRLEQGATYIDLRNPQPREFKALGNMEAGPENWYVPKSEIDYQLWNKLIGVDNPERLGEADDSSVR